MVPPLRASRQPALVTRLDREPGSATLRRNRRTGMAQNIILHADEMVAAAEREIENLPATEAIRLHGSGNVTFVDLRDIRELHRDGRVPGAFHCPRGMLEFWIDPASKYHKPVFAADHKFVFFCAAGARSALATQTARRMGLKPVAHIAGGFGAWKEAGGPVEMPEVVKR
jgi:rhodanese-related sulfurtransferase